MTIPFIIPEEFVARHALGMVRRYGTILKDAQSGRIVAHLQETTALHEVLRSTPLSLNPLTDLVRTTSSLASNFQLYRLDTKVEALRQMLGGVAAMQAASLALTGIGIGVSALGFAAVKSRLDKVSLKLDSLEEVIRRGFDQQSTSRLRDKEAELSGQLDTAEEAWSMRDGGRRNWDHVTKNMGPLENFYHQEIGRVTTEGAPRETFAYLIDRYRVCVATKLECMVLLDEFENAEKYGVKARERTASLFDSLTPVALAQSFTKGVAKGQFDELEALQNARAMVIGVRELQDMHATAPLLAARIKTLDVSGKEYVGRLKEEKEHPLLLLDEPA